MACMYEKLPLNLMKKRWKRCEKSLLSCEKKYSCVQIEKRIIDKDKIEYEELQEELEALEAIYIHELEVVKNDKDEVESIILQLHPATGDDQDKKYVCMTLQLDPPEQYPDVPPEMVIRNPRGIGDEEIQSLLEDMHKLAMDRRGGPMLYELIELAKESLTVGNIPHCLCMICLEHFYEGERFTRTDCYHYFHKSCLARYVQHFLTHDKEMETKKLTLHTNQEEKKVQCPVCREEISYDTDDLTMSPVEEKVFFQPSEEMRTVQAQMAAMLEKQRAKGGLIDVDAEKNKFLLKDDDVVQLPAKPNEEPSERPSSGGQRKDKASHGRRNRGERYRGDRGDNSYRKHDDRKDKGEIENSRQTGYRDYERPRSGFIRGKGRGRNTEERYKREYDDKNRKNIEGRQKYGEVKEQNDKEQKRSEKTVIASVTEEKLNDHNKEEILKHKAKSGLSEVCQVDMRGSVKEPLVSNEKKEEMYKLRYDEKINDRHKMDNQRYENKRQQRDNKRSPRNSSHMKSNSTTGQRNISNEQNEGKKSPEEMKDKVNNKTEEVSNSSEINKSLQDEKIKLNLITKTLVHEKSKESHKSEQHIAGNDELADGLAEDNRIQKPRGGFGKPKPKDARRYPSEFEKSSDRNDKDTERKRPQGGFGVPKSKEKNNDKMERPHSGFGQPNNNRFRNNRNDRPFSEYDHSKRTLKEDHIRKPDSGFENLEDKSEFDEEGHSRRNQYRRQGPNTGRMERSDWHSGRGNERYGYERRRNELHRNERNVNSNKNSDSKNWREPKTELRQDSQNYYKGDRERKNDSRYDSSKQNDRDKQSENDKFSRNNQKNENSDQFMLEPKGQSESKCKLKQDISEDFENKHIGDSAPFGLSSKSKNTEKFQNLREHDCDNEEMVECDRKSHPPGFRVGPPPGFKGNTKGAEEVVKPPPGF